MTFNRTAAMLLQRNENKECFMEKQGIMQKTTAQMIIELSVILGAFFTFFMILHTDIRSMDERLQQQGARTDKLYEMYCEMRKDHHEEMSEMRKEHHQEMSDIRKDHHEEMKEIYKHWST